MKRPLFPHHPSLPYYQHDQDLIRFYYNYLPGQQYNKGCRLQYIPDLQGDQPGHGGGGGNPGNNNPGENNTNNSGNETP